MHYFFSNLISNGSVILPAKEAHHAKRVLRLQTSDIVKVFDGAGSIYDCRIEELSKKEALLTIIKENKSEYKRPELTLLVAPTKSIDRFEWFLEKATEIGVGEIVPILTEHSERKVIKHERLEKVLVSAMKQSMNPYKPELKELTPFAEAIKKYSSSDRFISHCIADEKDHLFNELNKNVATSILIGPEGDFSPKEIELAIVAGWKPVTMGHQRFRTETAAVLAAHMFSLKQN